MITDVKISVQYKGNDNQWKIEFLRNGNDYSFEHIREIELISLYHCIAKELNNRYGCEFEYSEDEIKRCYDHINTTQNGDRNRKWRLEGRELVHDTYWTIQSTTTYGRFEIDELKAIISALGEFLKNNDVHRLSYENCKVLWLDYMESNIKFTPYDVYKNLFDEDADFSAENFEKARIASIRRRWEHASAMALTLWDTPNDALKVTMTKASIIFYKRELNECASYKYPPLHLLKKDANFIKAVTDCLVESCQYDKGDMNNWVLSDNDFPPFPLSVIFHSDYQNYDYNYFE